MAITSTNTAFSVDQFEEILIYFTTTISQLNCEDEVYWNLAKNCIAQMGFVDCVVYKVSAEKQYLIQKAAFGPKNPKDLEIYNPVTINLGQGISGTVAQTGIAEIVEDTSSDTRYIIDDQQRLSEIAVPIANNGEIFGVIDCEHPDRNYFTIQHLRMLQAVATLSAIKVSQLRTEVKVKQEQDKLLRIRKEMVDLKLKAFQAHMNPHFLFNTLNAIQYFITTDDKITALSYISTFSKLIRYYLKNFEKETLSLMEEIEMLESYLKLQKLRYDNRLDYSLNVQSKYPTDEAIIPSFILQTLFENIIEHAIFNQYENYNIDINIRPKKKEVHIEIAFQYKVSGTEKMKYIPDYRIQLMKWQDQIRLLNTFRNYKIKKRVSFSKNPTINGGHIFLKLPNLR